MESAASGPTTDAVPGAAIFVGAPRPSILTSTGFSEVFHAITALVPSAATKRLAMTDAFAHVKPSLSTKRPFSRNFTVFPANENVVNPPFEESIAVSGTFVFTG